MADTPEEKTCAACGRRIAWRAKWARNWDSVRYCGEKCRRTKIDATDQALEMAILELLGMRGRGATICPSEAAARVADGDSDLMERTRQAARRLVAAGVIEITQKGRVVDPSTARGPIRLRAR